jgi:hypothetical protein
MVQVGFATADITPEIGKFIPGGYAPRISTGVLDPLQARACVIAGTKETVAIVGVDAVSLRFDTVEKARRRINTACGIPERNVVIAASHTHSGGPSNDVLGTDSDEAYCETLVLRIAESVTTAHARLQEAEVGWALGRCEGWAFNRRFRMRSGGEATNPGKGNPDIVEVAGPVDPDVGVVAFRTEGGRWLGAIGNFTCHCTVVGGDKFSGDYPAYWQEALHTPAGSDFTLVFLNGACGDINQLDHKNPNVRESGVEWARRMGSALAKETMKCLESGKFTSEAEVASAHGGVRVGYRRPTAEVLEEAQRLVASDAPWNSKKWLARDIVLLAKMIGDARDTECLVDVVRVGGATIAAAPWQPFCEFGLRIKEGRRPGATLVAAFANGMLGYVPTPQAFKGGGYEPTLCRGSKLQPDAGGTIVGETVRLLKALR